MYHICIRMSYIGYKNKKKNGENESGVILHLYVHDHCSHTSYHNHVFIGKNTTVSF